MPVQSRLKSFLLSLRRLIEKVSAPAWRGICVVLLLVIIWLAWAFVHFGNAAPKIVLGKDTLQALLTIGVGIIGVVTFFLNRAQSQQQFEIKALNDNFTDILDRFANKDSIAVRANAAIRLAEMAQERLPGKPTDKIAENFPFFPRAASQLAAALHSTHIKRFIPAYSQVRQSN